MTNSGKGILIALAIASIFWAGVIWLAGWKVAGIVALGCTFAVVIWAVIMSFLEDVNEL